MDPLVSINIATYNSERTLLKCLDSVKKQTYKDVEIIIMDSHSKDKTLDIAKSFGAKIVFAATLARARQAGSDASSGKYMFLLDSDQVLDPDVIARCVKTCEEEGFDGVTLFEKSLTIANTLAEKIIAYDKYLFHSMGDDDPIRGTAIPRFFAASFYKKVDFLNNPPITFEHSIIHNEIVRMGAKIKFIDAYIYHHEPSTFREIFKKFFRYGYYYMPALKKESRLVLAHSLPRRVYFSKKALEKPLCLLGLFYLYFVKAMASFLGALKYIFDKITNRYK
ncbi:MAG: glycosyltransferase [Candidatus Omnitrophota bacterium]